MRDWKDRLAEREILVADGAWGTELAKLGLPVGEAPEAWNTRHPEKVRSIAAAYVAAGADLVLTNTFGGSRLKLARSGLADQVEELNRRGAELSREAAGERALVFASVGPTGEFLEPLGTTSEAEAVECFAEQVEALRVGGADGIVIETMADLNEAKAALKALRETCDLPAVACMTFEQGRRGYATIMGVRPEQAAEELQTAGADVVGANCGAGIEEVIGVIGLMGTVADLPLWAKPNAGRPELVEGRTVFRETPEQMADRLAELVEAGARIVGGCCGTTPDHIRLLAQTRDELVAEGPG
jgi:5-methyltetrahydrofolate--homocysteine methyltransferase